MSSRRGFVRAAAGFLALGFTAGGVYAVAQPAERVIRISAKRFVYTPNEIRLKKGVPVIIELTSEDIVMGFKVPAANVRADVMPGKKVRVRLVPVNAGRLDFLCDIFCGSGHEEMNGAFIVED